MCQSRTKNYLIIKINKMKIFKNILLAISISLISLLAGYIQDKPKVLIIGDSISMGYTPFIKENLSEKAEVFHNPGNAQHTGIGLKNIEKWIGGKDWDIIHFNWVLWDLCYRHPDSKVYGNRDKINGELTFSVDGYASNLDSLVKLMKQNTKARLVFATTTFVPEDEAGRYKLDVAKYNQSAKKVMNENNVTVNDIYEESKAIHNRYGKGKDDVHFIPEGYKALAEIITKFLKEEINNLNELDFIKSGNATDKNQRFRKIVLITLCQLR